MISAAPQTGSLISTLAEYLVKRAPVQIPEACKEFIVGFAPWISLVMLILTLPILLFALGIGTALVPFIGLGYAGGFGTGAAIALVEVVLLLAALPGLLARRLADWNLLFYEQIVGFVGTLLSGSVVAAIVGTTIALYILFQVREKYR